MASEGLELSHMDKENFGHPDFKRLHSEEDSPVKKVKNTGIKKSISWGNRSDSIKTMSFQREYIWLQAVRYNLKQNTTKSPLYSNTVYS